MNVNRKKAALKVYSPLLSEKSIEEVTELIKADEKGYKDDEVAEIVAALQNPEKDKPLVPVSPNAELDLSGFDYKALTGKKFREYVELVGDRSYVEFDAESGQEKGVVGKLLQNESFDFELFKVEVVRKQRFPGVKDTPMDFIGVKVKSDTPEHKTRIPISHALEYNAQILNAHSLAGHGKYYLLKK